MTSFINTLVGQLCWIINLVSTLFRITDVVEPNADPTGQNIGGQLVVDGKYEFSDLDELIVNHVQALARRVEELMAFEKFKPGPEDELRPYSFSHNDVSSSNRTRQIFS